VGRTDFCDYPEEAKNIESIGNIDQPNVEKIVELQPDVVIASSIFTKEMLQSLRRPISRWLSFRPRRTLKVSTT